MTLPWPEVGADAQHSLYRAAVHIQRASNCLFSDVACVRQFLFLKQEICCDARQGQASTEQLVKYVWIVGEQHQG